MPSESSGLDRKSVLRQFDRRVAVPDPADWLLREVESRMFERLELIRIEPACIVDVGCGLGAGLRSLSQRWPQAQAVGIDLSPRRAARAAAFQEAPLDSGLRRLLRQLSASRRTGPQACPPHYLAADTHALPFAADSVDLLWSNLAFPWLDDPPAAIAEWYRVLRPGGLLMFTALGVDSFAGLRAAGLHLPEWPDLHNVGDALVSAGFADPVMDTERLTVTWSEPAALLADLRALGGNALQSRTQGLITPAQRARRLDALCAQLRPEGEDAPMTLGVELVYGHAWIGPRKPRRDGWVPVSFQPSRPA